MRLARQIVAQGVGAWEWDDFESALKTFVGVLEDFPHFADVRNKAGLCEAMLGRLEKALLHFDAALEENPSYAEAHLNRGIVLNELGRHEEAQEAFDEAGQIDTRDSRAFPSDVGNRIAVTHAQLGDLYLAANRSEEAAQRKPRSTTRPRSTCGLGSWIFARSSLKRSSTVAISRRRRRSCWSSSSHARDSWVRASGPRGASANWGHRRCDSRVEAVCRRRSGGHASPRVPRVRRRDVPSCAPRYRRRLAARSLLLYSAVKCSLLTAGPRTYSP